MFTQKKNQPLRPFKIEIFSYSKAQGSCRLDHSANLKGRGFSGKFEPHFHRENGSEQEKFLRELSMRQKLFKTAKNLQAI